MPEELTLTSRREPEVGAGWACVPRMCIAPRRELLP